MSFTFDTTYDWDTMTTMARVLRKTLRKKESRRLHIFGWFLVLVTLGLSLMHGGGGAGITSRQIVDWIVIAALLVVLLGEDRINGYMAKKRIRPGMQTAKARFQRDGYLTQTANGTAQWKYEMIDLVAETEDSFVFMFGKSHGQIYKKSGISGGTAEEFSAFIQKMTGRPLQRVD